MIPSRRILLWLLALFAVMASACGDDPDVVTGDEPDPTTPTVVPSPAGEVVTVFAVDVAGGFVPVEVALSESASLVVLSDGTVYRPAPVPAIYPGPALPALESTVLSADELARVLTLVADAAALFDGIDFGTPGVTDMPSTTVTAWLDGARVTAAAYALSFDTDVGLDADHLARRAELQALITDVNALVDGAAAGWDVADPPALRVHSVDQRSPGDIDPGEPRDFPLAGTALSNGDGYVCHDVAPGELAPVLDTAATATQLTPWIVDGQTVTLVFRPVYPHDAPCR